MAITYPLALPTTPGIKDIEWNPRAAVASEASPYTYQAQVQAHQGQILAANVTLPPMKRAEAEKWVAWLMALNMTEGTFLLGDPDAPAPKGVATGTPLVNGAGQTGSTLSIKGLTPNITGIYKAGDKLQLGSGLTARLYTILVDADTDGSGNTTVTLWPRLRSSPADNAPIVTTAPKGLFRLTANPGWRVDHRHVYDFGSFSCIEAI